MKSPYFNAGAAVLYIVAIVACISFVLPRTGPEEGFLAPIVFLSMLVLSVALMGFLFFFQPLRLMLSGAHKESAVFFLKTVGTFALLAVLLVSGALAFGFGRAIDAQPDDTNTSVSTR